MHSLEVYKRENRIQDLKLLLYNTVFIIFSLSASKPLTVVSGAGQVDISLSVTLST